MAGGQEYIRVPAVKHDYELFDITPDDIQNGLETRADPDVNQHFQLTDVVLAAGAQYVINTFFERYPQLVGKVLLAKLVRSGALKKGYYPDFWAAIKVRHSCNISAIVLSKLLAEDRAS